MDAPLDKVLGNEGEASAQDLEMWKAKSALAEVRAKYYPPSTYYTPEPFEFAKLELWKPSKHAKKKH